MEYLFNFEEFTFLQTIVYNTEKMFTNDYDDFFDTYRIEW